MKQSPILSVKNLNVSIISKGIVSNIVNDLSFNVKRGEILSIVGESGSGKSMTAKAILRLLPENSLVSGKVIFENDNLPEEYKFVQNQYLIHWFGFALLLVRITLRSFQIG